MDRELWNMIDNSVSEFSKHLAGVFMFPKQTKFESRIQTGTVLYTKPKNELVISFKNNYINRRLQTKRVMTHTRK